MAEGNTTKRLLYNLINNFKDHFCKQSDSLVVGHLPLTQTSLVQFQLQKIMVLYNLNIIKDTHSKHFWDVSPRVDGSNPSYAVA